MQEELWGKQTLDHVLGQGVGGQGLTRTRTHDLARARGKKGNAVEFLLPTDQQTHIGVMWLPR